MVHARRIDAQRRPELARLRVLEIRRQQEPGRHDACHLERSPVDEDGAPDDPGILGVSTRPERVAEHDEVGPVWQVFLSGERTTDHRRDAERREHVGGHVRGADALGISIAGEVHLSVTPGGHVGQRLRTAAIVEDLTFGDPCFVERDPAAPDHHRPIGLGPWERPQEHGVHDGEDGGIRADPQGQGQRRNDGKRPLAAERAGAVAEILEKGLEKRERYP